MHTSEQIDQIGAAIAAAQGEMGHASKEATNPHFKSRYADLASVMDACRPALAKQKVAVLQSPELIREPKPIVRVTTRLVHASGQWVETALEADVSKTDPQTIGSAITYLRRYGLASLTSVAADDDDGNQAVGRPVPPPVREEPRQIREAAPPAALREAFEKTVGNFPAVQAEANRIFTATQMDNDEKIAALRDLYSREAKAARAAAAPPAPDAKVLDRAKRLLVGARHDSTVASQAESLIADYGGRLEVLSTADLQTFISELEGLINGRAA